MLNRFNNMENTISMQNVKENFGMQNRFCNITLVYYEICMEKTS